jgi:hypothetical protein
MRVASMKRISPPTLVHARPVATPVSAVRSATSLVKRGGPRNSCEVVLAVDLRASSGFALGDLHRDAADDARDLALEVADAGLARVVVDDVLEGLVGDLDLILR